MPFHARATGSAALAMLLAAGPPAAAQTPGSPLRLVPEKTAGATGPARLATLLAAGPQTPASPARPAMLLAAAAQTPGSPLRIVPEKPAQASGPARLAVRVLTASGTPAAGAVAVFAFPAEGPSAVFASGLRTEIVTAGADGRASVAGLHWTDGPGECRLAVRATWNQAQGFFEWLLEAGAPRPAAVAARRSGSGAKWLWIALLAGGGAAAGGTAMRGRSAPAAASLALPVVTPTVSAPVIAVTKP